MDWWVCATAALRRLAPQVHHLSHLRRLVHSNYHAIPGLKFKLMFGGIFLSPRVLARVPPTLHERLGIQRQSGTRGALWCYLIEGKYVQWAHNRHDHLVIGGLSFRSMACPVRVDRGASSQEGKSSNCMNRFGGGQVSASGGGDVPFLGVPSDMATLESIMELI